MARKLFSSTQRRGLLVLVITAVVAVALLVTVLVLQTVKAPSLGDQPSAPSNGQVVTITGTLMCLPHKNTDGPQTDECGYGLKAEDGKYYAIRDTDPEYKNISSAPMNERVKVSGTFTAGTSSLYPTIGMLSVTAITK